MSKENLNKKFVTGAEVAVTAAFDAGAQKMYGYPITPGTEVFSGWIKRGGNYLQTEDEIAAGFAVCGALIAGQKAFTATAGPGHVLMQDGLSMAEGMRLPFVAIVAQRGGPSSGTVIYSQQEVTLACYGGNGEGHRLVYSPANLEEVYLLTRQAFNDAWKYRFPAILLTDGYMMKTRGVLDLDKFKDLKNVPAESLLPTDTFRHWRNIYTFEEELYDELQAQAKDLEQVAKEIAKSEQFKTDDAEVLIIAHGIVAAAAKEAVLELCAAGVKVGLWRPITLHPLDKNGLNQAAKNVKKILFVESSFGQLGRLVIDDIAPELEVEISYLEKPALGIEVEEIIKAIK